MRSWPFGYHAGLGAADFTLHRRHQNPAHTRCRWRLGIEGRADGFAGDRCEYAEVNLCAGFEITRIRGSETARAITPVRTNGFAARTVISHSHWDKACATRCAKSGGADQRRLQKPETSGALLYDGNSRS